jgi:Polyketide cyclase / dehydrase and lipid transport
LIGRPHRRREAITIAAGPVVAAAARYERVRKGIDVKPISGEILIEASIEDVFDFVADERNEPRYNRTMLRAEMVTPGPIGAGTRFTALMRSGRAGAVTIEYTDFSRPRLIVSNSKARGMDIAGTLHFVGEDGGTRLSWSWSLRPRGLLRLVGPLVRMLGSRRERVNWAALKSYLEADSHR